MSNFPVSEHLEWAYWHCVSVSECPWGAWLCSCLLRQHAFLAHTGQGPGRSKACIVESPGHWRTVLGLMATVPSQKPL